MTERERSGGWAQRGIGVLATVLCGRFASQTLLVVSAFMIPAVLGAESYGRYAAVMAMVIMVQRLSSFGLSMVELRRVAPLWRLGPRADALILGSTILGTRLGLSAAAGPLAAGWLALTGDQLASGARVVLAVALLAFFRGAYESTRSLFLALGHVGWFVSLDVGRTALVLATVVLAYGWSGLDMVFLGLVGSFALLFAVSVVVLQGLFPLRLRAFHWRSLQPHLRYAISASWGSVADVVQIQFAVYAVAVWVAPDEAGVLALTLQILFLIQGLFLSCRNALIPILSELDALGEASRLRQWGCLMMRYGAALTCMAGIGWALVGGNLVALLPAAFAPVHGRGAIVLLGVAFFCCAATCNGLLLVRGLSGSSSANSVLHAAVTVIGVTLVLSLDEGAGERIPWIYALAAALFFAVAYLSLAYKTGLWLPLRRTLILLAPLALSWPAVSWDATIALKIGATVAFGAAYFGLAIGMRLLPFHELRQVVGVLAGWRTTAPRQVE